MTTAYNPNDPTQSAFLAAIAKGESGSAGAAAVDLGYGQNDLSADPTDSYGFPQWGGVSVNGSMTHAAGIYQFQPATWDSIASANNLNFQNPGDQSAAAWIDASQKYAAANNGADLETALQNGDYSGVASSLSSEWTSLTAGGIASAVSSGAAAVAGAATSAAASGSTSTGSAITDAIATFEAGAKNMFVRGSAVFVGVLVLGFGLYFVARNSDSLPSLT